MKIAKTMTFPVVFLLAGALSFSCSGNQSHSDHATAESPATEPAVTEMQQNPTFKDDGFKEAYQHYIHVKTALTASDAGEAAKGAKALAEALKGTEKVADLANEIAGSSDLKVQRAAFSSLSNEMKALVKENIASGEVHLAYCPMALNNSGAFWLTTVKEVKNPYFGDSMLTCGSIKETIN